MVGELVDFLVEHLINLVGLAGALSVWISDLDVGEYLPDAEPELAEDFPDILVVEEALGATVSEHLAEDIEQFLLRGETQLGH